MMQDKLEKEGELEKSAGDQPAELPKEMIESYIDKIEVYDDSI